MMRVEWGFIFHSVSNYMAELAEQWNSQDVQLWKNEPGLVSTEYTFVSQHFNATKNKYELMDRATALKAVFDGAMILDCLPDGRFDDFQLGQIVNLRTQKRNDKPPEANVLVEPFDSGVVTTTKPQKIIAYRRYAAQEMILQARYDPIAKGLLKHLGYNRPDFRTLYSLLDWMKTEGWTDKQIADVTGQSSGLLHEFTRTANNETVLGPMARHGGKGWKAPSKPVGIDAARSLILPAAKAFLQSRAEEFDSTGAWSTFVRQRKVKKKPE